MSYLEHQPHLKSIKCIFGMLIFFNFIFSVTNEELLSLSYVVEVTQSLLSHVTSFKSKSIIANVLSNS